MKRPTQSKELARQRALIRSLIEQGALGGEGNLPGHPRREVATNVEYLWDTEEAGHLPPPSPKVPANIIPFPDLRGRAGS